ncbi:Uncharacterised protein [Mycobacterium tuberculosis]|nr:Uncharacterised protein [Mycobacterium tuberculosis]
MHFTGAGAAEFTEQRVRQPGRQSAAGALDADQAHPLGRRQIGAAHQVAQHIHVQRLTLRQGVDHRRQPRAQPAHLAPHRVGQARRHRDVTVPHPHPGQIAHSPGGYLVGQQLPQEQGVAAGQLPESGSAARVHRAAQRALDDLAGCRGRQRFEVEAGQQPVLVQQGHRVGFLAAGAHGDHEARPARLRQLMHDERGQSVQQMRVVDPDHHPAATLLCDKGTDHPPHVGQRIRHRLAQLADERAQRQRARRFGAHNPFGALTRGLGAPQRLAGQPGLAHTGRPGDHHAGMTASPGQGAPDKREFAVAPGQRVGADHSATISPRAGFGRAD